MGNRSGEWTLSWLQRLAVPALGLCLASAAPNLAQAGDRGLVFPQVGFGYGTLSSGTARTPVLNIDLIVGSERGSGGMSRGALFQTGLTTADSFFRWELGIPFFISTGDPDTLPFVRLGVGPYLSVLSNERAVALGVGLQGEAATGLRDLIELYASARAGFDPLYPGMTYTAGIRLNALFLLYLYH